MKGKTRTGEKARGLLCTQGKWGFSVPSPPMSRRWQGQQQRFKKDTQYFSLSLFLSLSFQTHRHTHSLIYKGAEGQAFSNTHSRNPIISSATSLFPGSTMSPSSVILFAELQHCAPSTNFFWLDLLAILVTVHHRLSRKPEFSTQNISSPPPSLKKPSSGDGWSWATADSPANYIHTHSPSYSAFVFTAIMTNRSEIFLLCSIYHYAPRLYFSLTCSTQSNINKLSIYMGSFPSMKLIRNLGNAGDLKINLSYNYWHKPELLRY